jgi:hypothetical protein
MYMPQLYKTDTEIISKYMPLGLPTHKTCNLQTTECHISPITTAFRLTNANIYISIVRHQVDHATSKK